MKPSIKKSSVAFAATQKSHFFLLLFSCRFFLRLSAALFWFFPLSFKKVFFVVFCIVFLVRFLLLFLLLFLQHLLLLLVLRLRVLLPPLLLLTIKVASSRRKRLFFFFLGWLIWGKTASNDFKKISFRSYKFTVIIPITELNKILIDKI